MGRGMIGKGMRTGARVFLSSDSFANHSPADSPSHRRVSFRFHSAMTVLEAIKKTEEFFDLTACPSPEH